MGDDEWAFVAPYLTLMDPAAPQRTHELREVFNALRWIVRAGAPWCLLPTNFPPWAAVYQQTQRWLAAGSFEAMVHNLRCLLRLAEGRDAQPSAAIFDSRTLQSSPESGARAGYDVHKRKRGSKLHMAVDTLGQLLALRVTPADDQERAEVGAPAAAVQEATGERVEVAFVDQGYTGKEPGAEAAALGIRLEVVKLPQAKRGFVLLPRRRVVERTPAWMNAYGKLCRCTEKRRASVDFHLFLAAALAVVHQLIQRARLRDRWPTRPTTRRLT